MKNSKTTPFALGLLLGLVLTTAVGAVVSGHAMTGRFQLGATSGHAFLVDTATGQVWKDSDPAFSSPKAEIAKF